jgi:hypothetical protein
MKPRSLFAFAAVALVSIAVLAAETREALTAKLWPKARIEAALKAVDEQKAAGLLSDASYARRKAMLEQRLAGKFESAILSATNPPLNFIQNAGFEDIDRNSARNRSRWLWWGGWSWGGDYENMWEERPQYVHSGKYSARIACTGQPGRIGISTPALPVVAGATEYVFTVWAKGEGDNMIFLNFEEGVRGELRQKIGPEWAEVTLKGKPEPDGKKYVFYIYVIGKGTIWLDDAKLVPVGGKAEE